MTQKGYNNDLKEIPFDTIGAFNKQTQETMTEMRWKDIDEMRKQEALEQKAKIAKMHGLISDVQKTKRSLELRSSRLEKRESELRK